MSISTTTITSRAAEIAAALVNVTSATIYTYEVADVETPAILILGPEIARRDVDAAESQFGSFDLRTTWTLRIIVGDGSTRQQATDEIRQVCGLLIGVIDAAALGNLDAVISEITAPEFVTFNMRETCQVSATLILFTLE